MRRFVKRTRVKYNQRNYLSQRNYLFRYLLIILFGELRGLINVTCRRFLELRKDQMSIQDKFIYIYTWRYLLYTWDININGIPLISK